MKVWNVRPARHEDLEAVFKIEKSLLLFGSGWTFSQFLEELQGPPRFFWVITGSGHPFQVVGYLVARQYGEECYFLNIATHPECRRQGLAFHLCQEAQAFFIDRGARLFFLDVRVSNQAAIGLYKRLGWSLSGLRKKMYRDGENAYQMLFEWGSHSAEEGLLTSH